MPLSCYQTQREPWLDDDDRQTLPDERTIEAVLFLSNSWWWKLSSETIIWNFIIAGKWCVCALVSTWGLTCAYLYSPVLPPRGAMERNNERWREAERMGNSMNWGKEVRQGRWGLLYNECLKGNRNVWDRKKEETKEMNERRRRMNEGNEWTRETNERKKWMEWKGNPIMCITCNDLLYMCLLWTNTQWFMENFRLGTPNQILLSTIFSLLLTTSKKSFRVMRAWNSEFD